MNTYNTIISTFIERMANDEYSESRIYRIKLYMTKLPNYLSDNNYSEINEDIIVLFIKDT